jgi:hypothetical protein
MALTIEVPTRYPNVLLVTGGGAATGDYRTNVRDYLYGGSAGGSPVRRGTHDFWITYVANNGGVPNHSHEDMTVSPRPLRGIIEMSNAPGDTATLTLQDQIGTMLQEVGHHWLVPYDLLISHPDFWPAPRGPWRSMLGEEFTVSINQGAPYSGPLLLGRTNNHWSPYFQSDGSPFDGLNWTSEATEDGVERWHSIAPTGLPSVMPPGLPSLRLPARYCDLDLYLMGVKSAAEAYAGTNQFRWIEPQLAAPLDYQTGIFVAFSRYDYCYFGFHRDQRTVGVQRTNGSVTTREITGYRPFVSDASGIALRVVKRGSSYYFQVKLDSPTSISLTPRLLGSLDPPTPPDLTGSLNQFRTVAVINETAAPQAIGMFTKTWTAGHPILVDPSFLNFEIQASTTTRVLSTPTVPPSWSYSTTGYGSLPNSLVIERPAPGPLFRTRNGRLHLTIPYSNYNSSGQWVGYDVFDHWAGVDMMPKALTRAPAGDFAFATSARVDRAIYSPGAGGAAFDTRIWGRPRAANIAGLVFPRGLESKRNPPPDSAYKTAFILCAEQRSDIDDAMIGRVDQVRRYWDATFETLTLSRRHSSSQLG